MSLSVEAVDDINLPDYDYDADDDVNVSTRNVAAIGAIDIALLPSRNCRALPLLLHHLPPIRQSPFLPPPCPLPTSPLLLFYLAPHHLFSI